MQQYVDSYFTQKLATNSYTPGDAIKPYFQAFPYQDYKLNQMPPEVPLYERIVRNILAEKPRVTRYQIDWSN